MSSQAGFALRGRNPDVLTCIANLSNDEVFTPPEFANQMLDTLAEAWAADHDGANIWADKNVTFLDPFTKSGVFLREITTRLTEGLSNAIPDLQDRVDHILTRQVYGIAITAITSLLARRSLYCSKYANSEHSIAKSFVKPDGHVWFQRTEHTWNETKCIFCGAPKALLDRGTALENYAYAFIHTNDIKSRVSEIFGGKMQFDVIIGNPPYQMSGGAGGTSDSSIYHLFVQQAINLEARYVSMVIPSRWMAGGRGLDEFRAKMLQSQSIRHITDFPDSGEAFPGVQIKGGVCYFLWDGEYKGTCDLTRVLSGTTQTQTGRMLDEFEVLVRDERSLSVLRKVLSRGEKSVVDLISGDTPFGIATNYEGWSNQNMGGQISLHLINRGKRTIGYMKRDEIRKNAALIDAWKVLVPKAYGAGETFPHQILGREIVAGPPSACSQSYLTVSPFHTEQAAKSFASYYRTRLFRFLVSLRKITQDALRSTYSWVPEQPWDVMWTDDLLYEKYGILDEEIAVINSLIRPLGDADD
jgi:site-specific DNA-methyltransferase (adenine-specific)